MATGLLPTQKLQVTASNFATAPQAGNFHAKAFTLSHYTFTQPLLHFHSTTVTQLLTFTQLLLKVATFMPKPFTHLTGNSSHMHLSLYDASGASGIPVFREGTPENKKEEKKSLA